MVTRNSETYDVTTIIYKKKISLYTSNKLKGIFFNTKKTHQNVKSKNSKFCNFMPHFVTIEKQNQTEYYLHSMHHIREQTLITNFL
jgi:hypothetical protein